VTWKLKRGVTWHDGKPFTVDDLVFILWRNAVAVVSNQLKSTDISGWDSYRWRLAYRYRQS